jgi:uncharacterized protein (DUF433 family)
MSAPDDPPLDAATLREMVPGLVGPRTPGMIGRVVETPGVLGGRPRLDGTRIPTEAIWDFHDAGADTDEVLRAYPRLTRAT